MQGLPLVLFWSIFGVYLYILYSLPPPPSSPLFLYPPIDHGFVACSIPLMERRPCRRSERGGVIPYTKPRAIGSLVR